MSQQFKLRGEVAGVASGLLTGALLIGVSACSSSSKATDGGVDAIKGDGATVASFVGDRRVPLIPDDVQFIDFFVPHHRAAIDMANMVIERGSDVSVKSMATEMKTSQMAEIQTMRQVRQALTGAADSPAAPPDAHMQTEMAVMMSVSGDTLDKVFLEEMIPHHAGALPVAHRGQTTLTRTDLKMLASQIYAAQAREIGNMKMMLGEPTGGASVVPGDGGTGPGDDDTAVMGDRRSAYTPANDLAFIDFFMVHHLAAIDMATMVIERGSRADVKMMAQMMKDAQTAESAKMKLARQELASSPDSPPGPVDPHMMTDMTAMMALQGAALDRMFLEDMIPHHAAGLPAAHRGRPHLQRPDMRQLALDIFSAQAKEIGEMKTMLDQSP